VLTKEQAMQIAGLKTELNATASRASEAAFAHERVQHQDELKAISSRVLEMEDLLVSERLAQEKIFQRIREEAAQHRASEIAQLKTRVAALDQQLEMERERRLRLMDALKLHEVKVSPIRAHQEHA
jgi:hypothetical protein